MLGFINQKTLSFRSKGEICFSSGEGNSRFLPSVEMTAWEVNATVLYDSVGGERDGSLRQRRRRTLAFFTFASGCFGCRFFFSAPRRWLVANHAFYRADFEYRAFLAANSNGNGADDHGVFLCCDGNVFRSCRQCVTVSCARVTAAKTRGIYGREDPVPPSACGGQDTCARPPSRKPASDSCAANARARGKQHNQSTPVAP